ncbi:unnamed protein product [marine sediment metagenome]|uniref:Uncharacterized protein n=1 Tax=marine sediment metagenome TaxID=412755 RepID=X1EQM1_9ZZZZ
MYIVIIQLRFASLILNSAAIEGAARVKAEPLKAEMKEEIEIITSAKIRSRLLFVESG